MAVYEGGGSLEQYAKAHLMPAQSYTSLLVLTNTLLLLQILNNNIDESVHTVLFIRQRGFFQLTSLTFIPTTFVAAYFQFLVTL